MVFVWCWWLCGGYGCGVEGHAFLNVCVGCEWLCGCVVVLRGCCMFGLTDLSVFVCCLCCDAFYVDLDVASLS